MDKDTMVQKLGVLQHRGRVSETKCRGAEPFL
jgi:hypothetical protein